MTIFARALRDRRRSTLAWSAGLVALTALIFLYWPSVKGDPALDRFLRNLPEAVRALTGRTSFTSPAGYLNAELFSLMIPLLLLVAAIGMGARAIAGEEGDGTLELLVAAPVSRRRIVLEKVAAELVVLAVMDAALLVTLLVGARAADMAIADGRLAAVTVSVLALALPFGALALALGCATGARGAAAGATVGVAVAAYLLNALAPLSATLKPYRVLSPFEWYDSEAVLTGGLRWGHLALLLGTTVVLWAAAALAFERRDLA